MCVSFLAITRMSFDKCNQPKDFPDPETVDPHRRTTSIQGLGLHKCPGITFVERVCGIFFLRVLSLNKLSSVQIMPEVIFCSVI